MAADEALLDPVPIDRAVLVCIDAGYLMPLTVMLRSLGEGLREARPIEVFILHATIEEEHAATVAASLADLPLALNWIAVPPDEVRGTMRLTGYAGVPATYFRLVFDRYLPSRVGRVLYLDADLIVRGDVADLLRAEMTHAVAAVRIKPRLSEMLGFLPAEAPDAPALRAFNAGVMLIDRSAWWRDRIGERAMALASRYGERFRHWDQDALNLALAGAWSRLPDEWNHRPDPYAFPSWSADAAPSRPAALVHFAGPAKPWHSFSDYAETAEYFAILDRTAWRGWRPAPAGIGRLLWERLAERGHRRVDRLRELAVKARRSSAPVAPYRRLIAREVLRRPWLVATYPVSRRRFTTY